MVNFSSVFEVKIRKYRKNDLGEFENDLESVFVLADDIQEAFERAEEYAGELNQNGTWPVYDIETLDNLGPIFTGIVEDDFEEEELIPETGILSDYPGMFCSPNDEDYFA